MTGIPKQDWLAGLVLALSLSGCGVRSVAGTYEGSVNGTVRFIGIPLPVSGDVHFELRAASGDVYEASGDLEVANQSNGKTYAATLHGSYSTGDLQLTFTAKDGKSSGTMSARRQGFCWKDGTWTFSALGTGGDGSWSACRR